MIVQLDLCNYCDGKAMKRGLRSQLGLYDDAMVEEVECPNCGKAHIRKVGLVCVARGNGKSLLTTSQELGFCDTKCMFEWAEKNGIGW